MRRVCAALVLALAAALGAQAQADDSLYRALGQTDGIQALMTDFVARVKADARLAPFFKDINAQYLAGQLRDQVCELSGGPCKFDGNNMKDTHDGLGVGSGDFNRLVEVLQDAMDARAIPFRAQNRLLAILAPMHRDIVTRP